MALISQSILQNMFDPMSSPQDQTSAQQQGLDRQQNNELPIISTSTVDTTTTAAPRSFSSSSTIPGFRGSFEGMAKGATAKQEYRDENLFKVNSDYLASINKEIDGIDVNYATTIFQTLQKLPVVDGQTIPLSEFSTIIANDKNKAKKLLEQARQLEDDPTIDAQTSWNLAMMNYNSLLATSTLSTLNKKFYSNLRNVAVQADGAVPDTYAHEFNFHQSLFDDKGNLRTEKEFNKVISKKFNEIVTTGFLSEQNPRLFKPRYNYAQRRYNTETQLEADQRELNRQVNEYVRSTTPLSELYRKSLSKTPTFDSYYGKEEVLPEVTIYGPTKNILTAVNTREQVEANMKAYEKEEKLKYLVNVNSYEKVMSSLKKYYNREKSGAIYLGAEVEGLMPGQKGGDKQSPTVEFPFDMDNMKWKNKRGKIVFRPEVREFMTVGGLIKEFDKTGARAAIGNVMESVPSASSDETKTVSELMRLVLQDVQTQGEKYTDAEKRHKKHFFAGAIKFQGIVGGEEKFHAFHVKLNDKYLLRDEYSGGTQDNPRIVKANPRLASEGFTIYVPAEKSAAVTRTGQKYTESTTVSKIEGLLNMNKDANIFFNNAGNIQFTKLPDGKVTVGGYVVNFDPQTYSYDTTRLQPQPFEYNRTIDIDGYIREQILPRFQENFMLNKMLKNAVDSLRAIKDPSKLQPKQ